MQLRLTRDHADKWTPRGGRGPPQSPVSSGRKRKRSPCEDSGDEAEAGRHSDAESSCGYVTRIYLECGEGSSGKFYDLQMEGAEVRVGYGRRGSVGLNCVRAFPSVSEARDYMEAIAESKRCQGYVDIDSAIPSQQVLHHTATPGGGRAVPSTPSSSADVSSKPHSGGSIVYGNSVALQSSAAAETNEEKVYLVCTLGSSNKFYELVRSGVQVSVRYGRRGVQGVSSTQQFASVEDAKNFVESTAASKRKKGYCLGSDIDDADGEKSSTGGMNAGPSHVPSTTTSGGDSGASAGGDCTDDDLVKLERGEKVCVKGSSSLPYTMKKFNGGYSCTCPGWKFQIKRKGIQATSCKHLRELRGHQSEDERCRVGGGGTVTVTVKNGTIDAAAASSSSAGSKNLAIPRKISLANKWSGNIDLTLYALSEVSRADTLHEAL